jgi:hypothetical protein
MKKNVTEYTDDEIQARLDFARLLENPPGGFRKLTPWLQAEKDELLAEQKRRAVGTAGEGI